MIGSLIHALYLNKDYWKNPNETEWSGTGPAFALAQVEAPATLLLIDALKNENPDIRTGAAFVLGMIGDKMAEDPLKRASRLETGLLLFRCELSLTPIQLNQRRSRSFETLKL